MGRDGGDRPTGAVALRDGLVTDTDPPRLLGSHCEACDHYHFPGTAACPYCGAPDPTTAELPSRGRLWAWTSVQAPPPGYRGEVPYGFGVVVLPEQRLRLVTRLTEPVPQRLAFDQPMHLEVVELHRDEDGRPVLTYAFAPDDARDAGARAPAPGSPGTTPGGGRPA